jgi:hypothetical protein
MNQFFKKLEQLLRSMENATLYKVIIGIVLLAFWGYGSGWLTANPSLTGYVISFSYGMLAVVTIVIQLVLRENLQVKMKKVLNAEIEERKEGLLEELKKLLFYLERTKYPNYSESGVEGLEDDFREFDQIKSKYTFQPKIIHSTIFLVLSSLVLFLFWMNPTWVARSQGNPDVTFAHIGLGLMAMGLWMILSVLVISLEIKIWEKE